MSDVERLCAIIAPAAALHGFELQGVEWAYQSRTRVLRVYIDSEHGVTLEDCQAVSRQVGAVLDANEAIRGGYRLEVSSPGVNRRLFTLHQAERYIGKPVRVILRQLYDDQQRRFAGTLASTTVDAIVMTTDEQAYTFPWHDVEKVYLNLDILGERL